MDDTADPRAAARRMVALGEDVVSAHQTLERAAAEVGASASLLFHRIEELTAELEDVRARYSSETRAWETRYASDLRAEATAREREVQALKTQIAQAEADSKAIESGLRAQIEKLEEKLRRVVSTLS